MSDFGPFYGNFIDPVFKRIRHRVSDHIGQGQTVLDIACGTGAQLFEAEGKIKKAVGIDNSESMIQQAMKRQQRYQHSHIEFRLLDVTKELPFEDFQFDVAILSLALHQFNPSGYFIILNEMKRVAATRIFLDYAVPLPSNMPGAGSKVAEFIAGGDHYRNFKQYNKLGGLKKILSGHRLEIRKEEYLAKKTFYLVVCA